MAIFNILHLSDLHIRENEDPSANRLRESLIDDIKKVIDTKKIKIDAVAMTGDTVDKGGSTAAFNIASNFYEKLLDNIKLTKDKLLFIPGNHDIPRKNYIKTLMENSVIEDFLEEKKFEENWEVLEKRFGSYYEFLEKFNGTLRPPFNQLGSDVKIIESEKGSIKFFLINSSWACTGDNDYENIMVGRWQLERLKENVASNTVSDLTIALLHHPLNWLEKDDKKFLMDYFVSEKCLPVDLLLHGHIHDGNISSFMNPDKRITSFVTGIGYPEQTNEISSRNKVENCRYSIYQIDNLEGIVDVILRVTNKNGTFVADTKLFDQGGENGVLTYQYKNSIINSTAASKEIIHENNEVFEVDSVKIVHEWVGREEELKVISKNKLSVLAITGMGGQGKSALASEILRKYSRGERTLYEVGIWIDCRELRHSLHYKIIESLERISGGKETIHLYQDERIEDTVKRFIKHLQNRRMLIVFDNIDAYVKVDIEGPTIELKPFLESILNVEHLSLVVLTCRNPLTHESAGFYHLKLNGLNEKEGIEFFKKRNVEINEKNVEECKEIVRLTHGHPWWLGLITGQIRSNRQNLKDSINKLKTGYGTEREIINQQNYFNDVWNQLNKDREKILRYLAEAYRPLTILDIASFGKGGPPKVKQELNRLERMGLIEPHEGLKDEVSYQVHPLLREFVHGRYSLTDQQSYVKKVLYIFLPRKLVDAMFIDFYQLSSPEEVRPTELLDSIETCLLSRNIDGALGLIEQFKYVLIDKGYHHQFLSLACRILDEINWEDNSIYNRSNGANFLTSVTQQLFYKGETKQAYYYLRKYETTIEPNTIAYLNYLELIANIEWNDGEYDKAIDYSDEYEVLAEKLQTTLNVSEVKYTRALANRDSGEKVQEALAYFESLSEEKDDSALLGNIARCYYMMGDYSKAEIYLKKSLRKILSEHTYRAHSNLGFAYLWLVELMYVQKKLKESRAFFNLVQSVWSEYAPGLMFKVELVKTKYENDNEWNNIDIPLNESKEIEELFLSNKFKKL